MIGTCVRECCPSDSHLHSRVERVRACSRHIQKSRAPTIEASVHLGSARRRLAGIFWLDSGAHLIVAAWWLRSDRYGHHGLDQVNWWAYFRQAVSRRGDGRAERRMKVMCVLESLSDLLILLDYEEAERRCQWLRIPRPRRGSCVLVCQGFSNERNYLTEFEIQWSRIRRQQLSARGY